MTTPTTPTGKRQHDISWDLTQADPFVDGHTTDPTICECCRIILAIEAEAAAAERERLRALYMATEAGEYCDIDVTHEHNHGMCNARCWCSWADPDNCPYPEPDR